MSEKTEDVNEPLLKIPCSIYTNGCIYMGEKGGFRDNVFDKDRMPPGQYTIEYIPDENKLIVERL